MKTFGKSESTAPKINLHDDVRLSRATFKNGNQPDPNEFTFKLSKFQGDCERGTEGLAALLETKVAIEDTIKHMLKEYPEWTKPLIKGYESPECKVKPLTQDEIEEDGFQRVFKSKGAQVNGESIDDGVEIEESNLRFFEEKLNDEEIRFHVTKWQGKCEDGELGFTSLLVIKDQIDKAVKWTAKEFPDLLKSAQNVHEQSMNKDAEQSLSM